MTALNTTLAFSVREKGYDVGEVTAYIISLEERIAELEAALTPQEETGDLVSDVRYQALRLLSTAREDAEAMVEEARQEAQAIIEAARRGENREEKPIEMLAPRLEAIKGDLPASLQIAFHAVAAKRT